MNDDDVMAAVRDRLPPLRMDIPAAAIMKRGRALRRRRHGGRLAAAALALSLGAGLSVPALTGGGAAPAQQAALAAWTVHKHPDGSIAVTIRRFENLSGLKLTLSGLGVPVVIADGPPKPTHACAVQVIPLHVLPRRPSHAAMPQRPPLTIVSFEIPPAKTPMRRVLWIAVGSPARVSATAYRAAVALLLAEARNALARCAR